VQDLGAVDELELGERHDAVLIERRLEREVEAGERRMTSAVLCAAERTLASVVMHSCV
jgi:hypothetical protein